VLGVKFLPLRVVGNLCLTSLRYTKVGYFIRVVTALLQPYNSPSYVTIIMWFYTHSTTCKYENCQHYLTPEFAKISIFTLSTYLGVRCSLALCGGRIKIRQLTASVVFIILPVSSRLLTKLLPKPTGPRREKYPYTGQLRRTYHHFYLFNHSLCII
jgi:hypothetical protein